jgi:hypothetical protein
MNINDYKNKDIDVVYLRLIDILHNQIIKSDNINLIMEVIYHILENNILLPIDSLQIFIEKIENNSNYLMRQNLNSTTNFNIMYIIFTKYDITINDLSIDKLLMNQYSKLITAYLIAKKYTLNRILTLKYLNLVNFRPHDQYSDFNIDVLTIDNEIFEEMLSKKETNNKLIEIISYLLINRKIIVTQNMLYKSINSHKKNLFVMMLTNGCKIDNECLNIACKCCNSVIIEYLFENKLVPTSELFQTLLKNPLPSYIILSCIDIFVKYGYKINYDDLLLATKHKITIPHVERFDIIFDEKYMLASIEAKFEPYNIKNIKMTIKCLQKACENTNLAMIKKIVATGIKPDIICLENACKYKQNHAIIKYLFTINKNLKPNITCLKNMSKTLGNKTLNFLHEQIESFENNNVDISNVDNSNVDNSNVDNSNVDNNIKIQNNVENNVENIVVNNVELIDDVEKNKKDENNNIKLDIDVNKTEKNKPKIEPCESEIFINLTKIPENYNFDEKKEPNIKLFELLQIQINKNEKLNFISFRKKIIEFLVQEKLIKSNLLDINVTLAKILNSETKKYIKLDDMNDLIYTLINYDGKTTNIVKNKPKKITKNI